MNFALPTKGLDSSPGLRWEYNLSSIGAPMSLNDPDAAPFEGNQGWPFRREGTGCVLTNS